MTTAPELRYFNTGEVAINYAAWPGDSDHDGPTFLFVHGITDRYETWLNVADPIRRGAPAMAVDLRGHHRSGAVSGPYSLDLYPGDVTALIEATCRGQVIIVGHSLGALVAIQLAGERPDLVAAIVLEDPPLYGGEIMHEYPERRDRFVRNAQLSASRKTLPEMATAIRQMAPDASDQQVQLGASALFMTADRVIPDMLSQMDDHSVDWRQEMEERLKAIECPNILLRGLFENGGWLRDGDVRRFKELVPDGEIETWDDQGHGLHFNDQERFASTVNRFVDSLSREDRKP